MAYVLGQYNKIKDSQDDASFMTLITDGTADIRSSKNDSGVSGNETEFHDQCVRFNIALSNTSNYYFHGKIRRRSDSAQTFYIKLVNYNAPTTDDKEQYIKTITVAKGKTTQWVDVEFIFSPLSPFDCILFEMQRISADFVTERTAVVGYQELSKINNLITFYSGIPTDTKLIKIGVQSRPGLLMCINGEEIRTCRTGVYEIKNGIMTVSFFSVVNGTEEATTAMATWMADSSSTSRCFFATSKKTRVIDSFTIDYMYRKV